MKKYLEKYLLPIAMLIGIVFHRPLSIFAVTIPYLLFAMLFITYSRISWGDVKLTSMHYILLAIQYAGSTIIYLALRPINDTIAQAAAICILAPTATSAPVVAGILGGSISSVAAYSIISNLSVAFIAPLFLSIICSNGNDTSFADAFWHIFLKIIPILILPFVAALLLQKISPQAHGKVRSAQIVSFYLWAVALTIVIARVANFVMQQNTGNFRIEAIIVSISLAICLLQFASGRMIGKRFNRTVAGGQSLGQKNTILAIWLAQAYLNPLASLAPGMYVVWQNVVNSYQIWRNKKAES